MARLSSRVRQARRRANRQFYRVMFRVYRWLFPTPRWTGPLEPTAVRRILIVRDDRVGDMVLTTPLLAFLRHTAPQAEIDILASRANAPIVEHDPRVARVFVNDRTWRWWVWTLPRLRGRRYDVVLNPITRHPFRQGLIASLVARRETYKLSGWRPVRFQGLFTKAFRVPLRAAHMAESVLAVGQLAFGRRAEIGHEGIERFPVYVAPDPSADERVEDYLAAHDLDEFVLVNISAASESDREWPPEQAAVVVRQLLDRHGGLTVVITPAPGKEDLARQTARLVGGSVRVAPVFPLVDLVALVRRARLVVSPSTAPVHLASATGRPIVALYAPQHPNDVPLWLPLGVPYRAVVSELRQVMGDIAPGRVADAFDELWEEITRPAETRVAGG
jgi:ADP-heptose:LPS heptosyltransferase